MLSNLLLSIISFTSLKFNGRNEITSVMQFFYICITEVIVVLCRLFCQNSYLPFTQRR
ncbi:hypothetical protein HMPREF9163_01637 [Selenomonas sp. oral taxon 138 str. F0429]|nr:hypothetical protein HMPREF9163_01637 [Selenomonas sp. oral taxon 138 str. F0429]